MTNDQGRRGINGNGSMKKDQKTAGRVKSRFRPSGAKQESSTKKTDADRDHRGYTDRNKRNGVSRGSNSSGREDRKHSFRHDELDRPFDSGAYGSFPSQPEKENPDYRQFRYSGPDSEAGTEEAQEERILCGRNPIREALKSGRNIEKLVVQKGELSASARDIIREAKENHIFIQEADRRHMDETAPHHQGLIAYVSPYNYSSIEDMLKDAEEKNEAPFLILLDGINDPHNLGAIIRTAECAGAHGVIIPQHRSAGLSPAAVKASAGAIEHMKVARVVNLNHVIDNLKSRGIWTYALTMEGRDFEEVDFSGGAALIIGAEGDGVSRLTAGKCDFVVSLPMKGKIESLNASVAAGIVMYRVLCARRTK